jgi:hypothetical protein
MGIKVPHIWSQNLLLLVSALALVETLFETLTPICELPFVVLLLNHHFPQMQDRLDLPNQNYF